MIVGVAQVVLNVADLDRTCRPYLEAGWEETFRVERLPNHPAKAAMQAIERSALDMVHLTPREGLAVEVTRYGGAAPAGESVYEFDRRVRVRAADPQRSRAFWHALGFSERGDGLLEANAMLPAWRLELELQATGGPRPNTSVDAAGCVLVTLLTTAIEPELERLRGTSLLLRFTPSWTEPIGTRTVVVAIIEGPSGELVELLEAPRRAGRNE
jgi:catechol 2,3-dioxygenase-like lactoylglutathione lyase family enzyme